MANNSAFIEKLQTIVLEYYTDEQFGVRELVEQFGMSRSQLHRKLKSTTGQSVSQFIREIRLEEALKFLQKEDTTASEVSYKVGFNSPTYFNTCFHEFFGYPPGEVQHQMELAKSNEGSDNTSPIAGSTKRKYKRLVIGLSTIAVVVLSIFVYKYVTQNALTTSTPSEEKEKTIAVLPLKNWSGDVELEYVSDGMTDAIISKLSEIKDIDRVIPFTSMINYKDTGKDLKEIAKELDVAYVLEGNFKLSGTKVQSNLKLIEANTLEQVWNLEYTGEWKTDDIFEMQAAVAENVANTMSVEIANKEREVLRYEPTKSEEAYSKYLMAEYQTNKLNNFGLEIAVRLYRDAIALDSSFVEPYVGMANTYVLSGLVWGLIPEQDAWNQAKTILEKALVLDSLGSGINKEAIKRNLLDGLFYYELDIKETEKQINNAIRQKDEGARWGFSFDVARKVGRLSLAMTIIDNRIESDPVDWQGYMQKAIIHYMQGDKQKALKLLEINDPLSNDNYFYLMETSKWYYYMNEIEKSKSQLKSLISQFQDHPPIVNWLIAVHSEIEGNDTKLQSSLETLQQQYKDKQSGSPAWFMALYYFHISDKDSAFNWLNKSYDQREVEMTWLKEEPMLMDVKEDPRYIELYHKLGFQYVDQELQK